MRDMANLSRRRHKTGYFWLLGADHFAVEEAGLDLFPLPPLPLVLIIFQ